MLCEHIIYISVVDLFKFEESVLPLKGGKLEVDSGLHNITHFSLIDYNDTWHICDVVLIVI